MPLEGKKILLGVTGGIGAYKACLLTRLLREAKSDVKVVLTENGARFITPLTLSVLSGNRVYESMFQTAPEHDIRHISLADWCDLLLVAPASANFIGKLAAGLADDLLSTIALAVRAPVIVAPAMNAGMYENHAVSGNMRTIVERGIIMVDPGEGALACGREGIGRLAEPATILEEVEKVFTGKNLAGANILVTAGPTREPVDAVRHISNPSSGKMGYEIAKAAWRRGAETTLVSGPVCLPAPRGVETLRVNTAQEMKSAVLERYEKADAVVMAAAVSDFRPESPSTNKIGKSAASAIIKLAPNPDILEELGRNKGNRVLAGFSMDTGPAREKALSKLKKKNLDFIVSNDLSAPGAGFGSDTNIISIFDKNGSRKDYPEMPKADAAGIILDRIAGALGCLSRL